MTMAGIEQLSTYSSVCFAFPRDLSSIVRPSNLAPPRIVIYAFRLINFSLIFFICDISEIVRVKRRHLRG